MDHMGAMNKLKGATFIVLIPKNEGARELGNFHPISLISSLYKIISSVLSLRLRLATGSVVTVTQSAFIKSRHITNSILIANECIDMRKRSKLKGVVCKLDIEKAYDKVEWNFLFGL